MFIGRMLRDELLRELDVYVWSPDEKPIADHIRGLLETGRPHRTGFKLDDKSLRDTDVDFLRDLVQCVQDDHDLSAHGRGLRLHQTPIGRELYRFREAMGWS